LSKGGDSMNEEGKVLVTDNEEAKEEKPSWHCDIYCRKVRYVTCEGREFVDETSEKRCPYLEEMLY
jgi:hypothetical protein